jgi:hypothetical protein
MIQIFTGYAVATALVVIISFATITPSAAAPRRNIHDPATAASATGYAARPGNTIPPGGRTNPTLPEHDQFGPPDPASCGGFHC